MKRAYLGWLVAFAVLLTIALLGRFQSVPADGAGENQIRERERAVILAHSVHRPGNWRSEWRLATRLLILREERIRNRTEAETVNAPVGSEPGDDVLQEAVQRTRLAARTEFEHRASASLRARLFRSPD